MQKKRSTFPISVKTAARGKRSVEIIFLSGVNVLGNIVVRDFIATSTIDIAWHNLLKRESFRPNEMLPQDIREALAVMSKQYRTNASNKELVWKFIQEGNIYEWRITPKP